MQFIVNNIAPQNLPTAPSSKVMSHHDIDGILVTQTMEVKRGGATSERLYDTLYSCLIFEPGKNYALEAKDELARHGGFIDYIFGAVDDLHDALVPEHDLRLWLAMGRPGAKAFGVAQLGEKEFACLHKVIADLNLDPCDLDKVVVAAKLSGIG